MRLEVQELKRAFKKVRAAFGELCAEYGSGTRCSYDYGPGGFPIPPSGSRSTYLSRYDDGYNSGFAV